MTDALRIADTLSIYSEQDPDSDDWLKAMGQVGKTVLHWAIGPLNFIPYRLYYKLMYSSDPKPLQMVEGVEAQQVLEESTL